MNPSQPHEIFAKFLMLRTQHGLHPSLVLIIRELTLPLCFLPSLSLFFSLFFSFQRIPLSRLLTEKSCGCGDSGVLTLIHQHRRASVLVLQPPRQYNFYWPPSFKSLDPRSLFSSSTAASLSLLRVYRRRRAHTRGRAATYVYT